MNLGPINYAYFGTRICVGRPAQGRTLTCHCHLSALRNQSSNGRSEVVRDTLERVFIGVLLVVALLIYIAGMANILLVLWHGLA